MKSTYRRWLQNQGYADVTVQAQMHRAGRVEQCYGDLDQHYETDRLRHVIDDLKYSTEDERRNKPNPSKIAFEGKIQNNLASYRNAIERYCKFRREATDDDFDAEGSKSQSEIADEAIEERGQIIGLERDLQAALRHTIGQLDPGLEIIDEGAERSVSSGFIDITARDPNGAIVVIELKTGTARQRAVAQILSYMGDIAIEEPDIGVRGILVAGDFDKKVRAAARVVPTLSLRSYRVNFEFTDANQESP
jgi:Endonuclease NucS C-terminal domain